MRTNKFLKIVPMIVLSLSSAGFVPALGQESQGAGQKPEPNLQALPAADPFVGKYNTDYSFGHYVTLTKAGNLYRLSNQAGHTFVRKSASVLRGDLGIITLGQLTFDDPGKSQTVLRLNFAYENGLLFKLADQPQGRKESVKRIAPQSVGTPILTAVP